MKTAAPPDETVTDASVPVAGVSAPVAARPAGSTGEPVSNGGHDSSEEQERLHAPPPPPPQMTAPSAMATTMGLLVVAVIVFVGCTAMAWFVSTRSPDVYGAEAELMVPVRNDGQPRDVERELGTQMAIIDGPGVLQPAAERLGLQPQQLDKSVSASVVDGTQIIRVRATGADRDEAVRILDGVVEEYTAGSTAGGQDDARRYLEEQLTSVSDELAQLQRALDAHRRQAVVDPARDRELSAQIASRSQRQTALQDQLLQMELEDLQAGSATVVSSPRALVDRVAPQPVRSAAMGSLAGLVLATGILVGGRRLLRGGAP